MAKITIQEYDPHWSEAYEQEEAHLLDVVGPHIDRIEHTGSTSVRGLAAKPVIDILIGVNSLEIADRHCVQPIESLGYSYVQRFESTLPNRRYFRKDNDGNRTHQIHLVLTGSDFWHEQRDFRDWLRSHPDDASKYATLKRDLAEQEWENVSAYAEAKGYFIQNILRRSRENLGAKHAIAFRPAESEDSEFAYQTKRAVFKPYVDQVWGWEDNHQRELHETRFEAQEFRIIQKASMDIGVTAAQIKPDHLHIYQIFLPPDHQGQGTGTVCMRILIEEANAVGLPAELQTLHVNSDAASFYHNLGFRQTGQTDTHVQLRRECERQ